MGGTNDEKSLSTRRPMNVPRTSAPKRSTVQTASAKPERRRHRHAHAPTANTGLVGDVLWAIRDTVKVYAPRTRNTAAGAASNASSAPCALVRPMLKYWDKNGVKLIVRVEMMF